MQYKNEFWIDSRLIQSNSIGTSDENYENTAHSSWERINEKYIVFNDTTLLKSEQHETLIDSDRKLLNFTICERLDRKMENNDNRGSIILPF